MAERRVGTFDRTSPKPGDHGEFLTLVLGQIRTFGDYLGSDFDLRIKMADSLLGFVTHPCAIATNILRQPFCTRPILKGIASSALFTALLSIDFQSYRRTSGELGWNFDHRFVDGHRHRVEVRGIAF